MRVWWGPDYAGVARIARMWPNPAYVACVSRHRGAQHIRCLRRTWHSMPRARAAWYRSVPRIMRLNADGAHVTTDASPPPKKSAMGVFGSLSARRPTVIRICTHNAESETSNRAALHTRRGASLWCHRAYEAMCTTS